MGFSQAGGQSAHPTSLLDGETEAQSRPLALPWQLSGNQHLLAISHVHTHTQLLITCGTPPELTITRNVETNEILYLANSFPPFTGCIQLPRAGVEKPRVLSSSAQYLPCSVPEIAWIFLIKPQRRDSFLFGGHKYWLFNFFLNRTTLLSEILLPLPLNQKKKRKKFSLFSLQ